MILKNITVSKRSQARKSICIWNSRRVETNLQWQKTDQCWPGAGAELTAVSQLAGTFWENRNVLYHDCDSDYTDIYTCQNSSSYTFIYMQIIPP